MDWREFIASIVGSLAWPASIAIIVLLLRRQLAAVLEGRLKSLKAGPVAIEFWAEQVAEVGVAIASGETPPSPQLDAELERIAGLVDQTPVVAVRQAFGLVERRLRVIADASGTTVPAEMSGAALAAMLQQMGLISEANLDAVRGLATLVNLASRDTAGTSITVERARDFMVLAQAVLYALSRPLAGTE